MSSAPTREVARRVFAREFNDATYTFTESDDDRAPVYVLLPTGQRANRIFVAGTLTETEDVGEDAEYWQGRVVDPNGDTFFTYAGQYQPDAAAVLRDLEPPEYVAMVGKPRTYETDEGDVNVSVRPESITTVQEATRDRWVVETAERTLDRIERFEDATDDGDAVTEDYVAMATEEYDLPVENYRRAVVEALEDADTEAGEPEATAD
jgi:RPA family protein